MRGSSGLALRIGIREVWVGGGDGDCGMESEGVTGTS